MVASLWVVSLMVASLMEGETGGEVGEVWVTGWVLKTRTHTWRGAGKKLPPENSTGASRDAKP